MMDNEGIRNPMEKDKQEPMNNDKVNASNFVTSRLVSSQNPNPKRKKKNANERVGGGRQTEDTFINSDSKIEASSSFDDDDDNNNNNKSTHELIGSRDLCNDVDWILSLGVQLRNCTYKFEEFLKREQKSRDKQYKTSDITSRKRKRLIHDKDTQKVESDLSSSSSSSSSSVSSSDSHRKEDRVAQSDLISPHLHNKSGTAAAAVAAADSNGKQLKASILPKPKPYYKNTFDTNKDKYKVLKVTRNEKHAEDHWIYRPLLDSTTSTSFPSIFKWPFQNPIPPLKTFIHYNDTNHNNNSNNNNNILEVDLYYEDEYGDSFIPSPIYCNWDNHDKFSKQVIGVDSSSSSIQQQQQQQQQKQQSTTQDTIMDTILNDMIHQAWNQAVHLLDTVVSCDLPFSFTTTSTSFPTGDRTNTTTLEQDMTDMFIHMNIPSTPVKYIDLDGITWFQCQTCTSPAFYSNEEWNTHFYGYENTTYTTTATATTTTTTAATTTINQQQQMQQQDDYKQSEGCGCIFFKKRQYEIIQKILFKEAMFIVDGILHIILSHIKKIFQRGEFNYRANFNLLDWKEVIQVFEQAIHPSSTSSTTDWKEEQVLESLLVHPNLLPMPINNHVITTAKLRLIERYGKFNLNLQNKNKKANTSLKKKTT